MSGQHLNHNLTSISPLSGISNLNINCLNYRPLLVKAHIAGVVILIAAAHLACSFEALAVKSGRVSPSSSFYSVPGVQSASYHTYD